MVCDTTEQNGHNMYFTPQQNGGKTPREGKGAQSSTNDSVTVALILIRVMH